MDLKATLASVAIMLDLTGAGKLNPRPGARDNIGQEVTSTPRSGAPDSGTQIA